MFFKVITTIAVTVALFVLAAQATDPRGESGIAIPLTKRTDTDARKFHTTSHNAKIIRGPSDIDGSERNTGTPHLSAVERDRSGAGLGLRKYRNGIWYGNIWIGTPPRPFTVQLSTGTSDLFVPHSTGDENCRSHHNLWNPASSQTNAALNEYFGIDFTDGRIVRGTQYMDNVTIAGFTADIQIVGAATTYSSRMGASDFAPDGILGLAFPSFSHFYIKSPLLHTLFNEGQLSQPVFSLKLTDSGGELYIGGTNRALYVHSTLVYTPVTNPVLWQLRIDSIKVNEITVLRNVPAIMDTGANFIYGDPQRVIAVYQVARGALYQMPQGSFYTFPCKYFPTVTLTIGGRPFLLPPNALNMGRAMPMSPNCLSGIVDGPENLELWSIGAVFLQQFYTVYDFNSQSPRIGIAELQGGA